MIMLDLPGLLTVAAAIMRCDPATAVERVGIATVEATLAEFAKPAAYFAHARSPDRTERSRSRPRCNYWLSTGSTSIWSRWTRSSTC